MLQSGFRVLLVSRLDFAYVGGMGPRLLPVIIAGILKSADKLATTARDRRDRLWIQWTDDALRRLTATGK